MGGRLLDWLGSGAAGDRPTAADALANTAVDSTAFYFAVDTKVLSILDQSGPTWYDIDAAALAAIAFLTLPDVDATGLADGNVFKYDVGSGTLIPLALAFQTSESIQDLVGAMIANGTGTTGSYDDGAGTFKFDSTITQYTDELAQDAIGAAFAAGSQSGITVTYNDVTNSFDFTVSGATYADENAQDAIATAIAAGTQTGITIAYNDGAGAFSFTIGDLGDLADVDLSTPPTDGQVLTWINADSAWEGADLPAAVSNHYPWIFSSTFAGNDTGSFATLGTAFYAGEAITIDALLGAFNAANIGDVYSMFIAAISSAGVISSTVGHAAASFTTTATGIQQHRFDLSAPVTLTPGQAYIVCLVITSGSGTTACRAINGGSGGFTGLPCDFAKAGATWGVLAKKFWYSQNSVTPGAGVTPVSSLTSNLFCVGVRAQF